MGRERSEPRCERSEELEEGAFNDHEEYDKGRSRDISKHRSKDKKKSQREEKDHAGREREKEVKDSGKERISSKEKKKEDKEEHEKDRTKDKLREKDHERDNKHRIKDHDRGKDEKERGRKHDRERQREDDLESNRGRDKERGKEKNKDKEKEKERAKDRDRERDREKGKEKEKEKERTRDRERERDHDKNRVRDIHDKEQVKETIRGKEREIDHGKDRSRDREKASRRSREDHDHHDHHHKEEGKYSKGKVESDDYKDRETSRQGKTSFEENDHVENVPSAPSEPHVDLEQRILQVKGERLAKKSEGALEILSWVNKSRKLEEKRNSEKEKALQRSRIFEEQDNHDDDFEDEGKESLDELSGVKVLHGLDKVVDGGSVVLTLKDQEILTNGDVNEDMDMLENAEIGEQKRRNEAYKAAKKKTGTYDDKFSSELEEEKKMLPQYDDPAEEEGVTLGAGGRFTAEAEKKLEELRRRLQGTSVKNQAEDLSLSAKTASDYYTPEEMLRFKKPKKKKSLRKKEKLDIDALEAEAISAGLGTADLGSRNDTKRQAAREEQEKFEADRRFTAYQTAYAKAEEASKALRMEQALTIEEESDKMVFADDAEDLQKSLERARKLALKKQNEKAAAGPEAVAHLASSATKSQLEQPADAQNANSGESESKVVFTEMEEFVWGLQLDKEPQTQNHEDVFMEEDEEPKASEVKVNETGGWAEVVESGRDEELRDEDNQEVVPDETIHEAPVGKGLSGVLKMLKDRGTLKETIEWGGRNMDKKKSKLVGIHEEGSREINLERTDEYGRVLTPKEAFRLISHKFHGKGPGKMKQEKRMKQYYDELKLKQMTSSDVLPQSVERMRDAQAQLKTPYLVLSGHVKPGQTSDPRSGFATVEKEVPGSLTPMLGDKKVEHFLGIKRKAEPGAVGTTKKPKT